MQGPDWTQWEGNYILARSWYGTYVPELKEVIEMGKNSNIPKAKKLAGELDELLTEVMNSPNHNWAIGKEDPAKKAIRKQRRENFLKRYK